MSADLSYRGWVWVEVCVCVCWGWGDTLYVLVNLIKAPVCFEVAVCGKRKITESDKDLLELNAATLPPRPKK